MKKTAILIIMFLQLTFLVTGCSDYQEIDELAIVLMTGLDLGKDGTIIISSQIAIPQALGGIQGTDGDASDGFVVYTQEGKNINVAVQFLQQKLSRTLFYDHRRVLLIGEELAKNGLKEIMDHYTRNPASRLQTYILIAKESTAADLLTTPVPFETNPGEALKNLIETDINLTTSLNDFINDIVEEGVETVVGSIEMVPSLKDGSGGIDMMTFQFSGAAVFKDYQLIDYLDKPTTRSLMWMRDQIGKGYMTGRIPDEGEVSMQIIKASTEIETTLKDNQIEVNITAKASGPIYENTTSLNLANHDYVKKAEQAFNEILEERLQGIIDLAQNQLKTDIFGIGQEIHRRHPNYWREVKDDWNDIFPTIEFNVKTVVTVTNTGMYGPPLHLKEEDIQK